VGVAPADFELLRPAFDRDSLATALVADDAGDGARVDRVERWICQNSAWNWNRGQVLNWRIAMR